MYLDILPELSALTSVTILLNNIFYMRDSFIMESAGQVFLDSDGASAGHTGVWRMNIPVPEFIG
jgi:hypothetical protein